jgi:hypothetical protein
LILEQEHCAFSLVVGCILDKALLQIFVLLTLGLVLGLSRFFLFGEAVSLLSQLSPHLLAVDLDSVFVSLHSLVQLVLQIRGLLLRENDLLLLEGLLALEVNLFLSQLILLGFIALLENLILANQFTLLLSKFSAMLIYLSVLLCQVCTEGILLILKSGHNAFSARELQRHGLDLFDELLALSTESLLSLIHLLLVNALHVVEGLLSLAKILVKSLELLILQSNLALVLRVLRAQFISHLLQFALQHVDIVLVVGGLLSHLGLVLLDHLVVAALSSFLLFVEALLKTLLLRLVEGLQFLKLLLRLLVDLLQGQLMIMLLLVDFLLEIAYLILVAMIGFLNHFGALGLLALGKTLQLVSFFFC